MVLNVYTVYDKAVKAFMTPFFCRTDAEATRSFADACSDPKHSFNSHLSDYVLYRSGCFDDAVGELMSLDSPEKIVDALSLGSQSP